MNNLRVPPPAAAPALAPNAGRFAFAAPAVAAAAAVVLVLVLALAKGATAADWRGGSVGSPTRDQPAEMCRERGEREDISMETHNSLTCAMQEVAKARWPHPYRQHAAPHPHVPCETDNTLLQLCTPGAGTSSSSKTEKGAACPRAPAPSVPTQA